MDRRFAVGIAVGCLDDDNDSWHYVLTTAIEDTVNGMIASWVSLL